jgi:hypothetical protein
MYLTFFSLFAFDLPVRAKAKAANITEVRILLTEEKKNNSKRVKRQKKKKNLKGLFIINFTKNMRFPLMHITKHVF